MLGDRSVHRLVSVLVQMGPCCCCWLDPHQVLPPLVFGTRLCTAVCCSEHCRELQCSMNGWWRAGATTLTIWFVRNKELWLYSRFTGIICKFCITSKPYGQLIGIEWRAGSSGVLAKNQNIQSKQSTQSPSWKWRTDKTPKLLWPGVSCIEAKYRIGHKP